MNYIVDTLISFLGFFVALRAVCHYSVKCYADALPYLFGMLGWVTFGALSISNYIPITYIIGEEPIKLNMSLYWIYTGARFLLLIGWFLLVEKTLLACKIKHRRGKMRCPMLKKSSQN